MPSWKITLAGTFAVLMSFVFSFDAAADPPEPLPPGHGMYIMVLRPAAPSAPGDPKPRKRREPDIPKLGGSVKHKDNDRRVIVLPLAAVKHLRADPDVAYLQRIWMGERFETWDETDSAGASSTLRSHADDAGPTWTTGAFSYDGSGNIQQMGSDTYSYDSAGRLLKAVVSTTTETYKYDSFGNLVEKTTGGSTTAVPTDSSSNRLSGETYDERGSVVTQDRLPRYTYDSLGMLTMVEPAGTSFYRKRMLYTADDERIAVLWAGGGGDAPSDSRWTMRDFDGKVLRHFFVDSGGYWMWMGDYIYSEGRLVGEDRPSVYGGKLAFHLDHLGSVRMMTAATGLRYGRHDYYPFGTEQTSSVQEITNFFAQTSNIKPEQMKFTSHQRDFYGLANVDNLDYLDYMHARFYNPNQGRFLSVDPMLGDPQEPQSWNRYAYVTNNPLNLTDPSGMCGEPVDFIGPTTPCDMDFAMNIEVAAEEPGLFEHINFIAEETTAQITPFGPLPGTPEGMWSAYQDRQFLDANPDWKPPIMTGVIVVGPLSEFRITNLRYLQGGRLLRGNVTQGGGVAAARGQFQRLTGRAPVGTTDSAKLADGTVVKFRASGSGGAKVEINDPLNQTYQKTTFTD